MNTTGTLKMPTAIPTITARARECPARCINEGLKIQPIKKPAKCPEVIMPISIGVKPSVWPEMVSKGRSEPMPICTRMMESSNADSEISSFMRRLPALSETAPVEIIPTETVSSKMVAS